jgi:hypothetical protein
VSTDQVERSLILVILILYNKIKTFTKICLFVNQKIVEANGWIQIIPSIKLQHQLPDLENYQLWKLRYRQLLELHQACLSKVELEQHKGTELQWHLG